MRFQTTNGHWVEIDDSDGAFASDYRWIATNTFGVFVVSSSSWRHGRNPNVRLSRLLLGAKAGEVVDHIDGNGLNNTRGNLRLCSAKQNAGNRKKRKGKYKFKGIWPNKDGTWAATVRGRRIGNYGTEEEAALGYDREAEKVFGEFASLNFPDRKDVPFNLGMKKRFAGKASTLWGRGEKKVYVPKGRPLGGRSRFSSYSAGQLALAI
jgi:hypothetical protein